MCILQVLSGRSITKTEIKIIVFHVGRPSSSGSHRRVGFSPTRFNQHSSEERPFTTIGTEYASDNWRQIDEENIRRWKEKKNIEIPLDARTSLFASTPSLSINLSISVSLITCKLYSIFFFLYLWHASHAGRVSCDRTLYRWIQRPQQSPPQLHVPSRKVKHTRDPLDVNRVCVYTNTDFQYALKSLKNCTRFYDRKKKRKPPTKKTSWDHRRRCTR